MKDLVYYVAVSLDGYIAAPDHTFDAFPVEGDHIDMILREYTDTLPAPGLAALGLTPDRSRFDTVVMGANTYRAGLPHGITDPYPHLHQYVCSREDMEAGGDVVVTAEDPVALVRRLKGGPGSDIWLCGGGMLATTLLPEIDRLILKVNPLLLGSGIPVFAARAYDALTWDLTVSTPYRSGVVINEYRRARRPGAR